MWQYNRHRQVVQYIEDAPTCYKRFLGMKYKSVFGMKSELS